MEDSTEDSEDQGKGFQLELIRSYLGFARRAIKTRKGLVALLACGGLALTAAIVTWFPRTFSCTTVLMTVSNPVLDSDRGPSPLAGAEGLIMRHENLETLIRETDLISKYRTRRPGLLRIKDRIIEAAFGKMDDKTMRAVLVGTLEARLAVDVEEDTLTITVNWSDRETTAEIAEAAKQGFLKMRHATEISAFTEKMAILDRHASSLREEIGELADQMNAAFAARAAQVSKVALPAGTPSAAPLVRGRSVAATDEQLPEQKEKLIALKLKLVAAENERNARIRDERSKLAELKLKLTPSHPQVVTQEERLAIASQLPSELALLRGEQADMEAQIKQREGLLKTAQGLPQRAGAARPTGVATDGPVNGEPLPSEIMQLLARDDGDPALTAQISSAVIRYGTLRDDVRAGKLALDTAQAAFNHRYQVVIPVEAPNKPSKPNLPLILGAGLFLSLLLAGIVPVLLELRKGVLVEYWQVHSFQLPVLAELRLSSRAGDYDERSGSAPR